MLARFYKQLLLIGILSHDGLDEGYITQEHYGKFYATNIGSDHQKSVAVQK
jgi:hypothetical protein